jgi:F0F1-type ATP synthase membrane subunit b/b'
MDILDLIDMVEETIENSFKIPFTSKGFVDKEELLETIKQIRLKFPDELKQAKFLIEDRQRIMAEAQKEADNIIKNATDKVNVMVSEHEITKQAQEEAMRIMEAAQNDARNMRMATKEYVVKTMGGLEASLTDALMKVKEDKRNL